jgi:hypothetical protein
MSRLEDAMKVSVLPGGGALAPPMTSLSSYHTLKSYLLYPQRTRRSRTQVSA